MSHDKPLHPDAVETLVRLGGRRADPPAAARHRAWAATRNTWQRDQSRRRVRRTVGWLAAAAAVLVAVGALFALRPATISAPAVARLDRAIGPVEMRPPGAKQWRALAEEEGLALPPGTRLRTSADSRLGLNVAQGVSVRLAGSSQLELSSDRRIRLVRGVIYVDTGPLGRAGPVQVVTDTTTFEDFGTQFEVHYMDGGIRLRVREGQVVFGQDGDRLVARAEEQVDIDAQGRISRRAISRSDGSWSWIEAVSPTAPTDGEPLSTLLAWVSRETGRTIHYANDGVKAEADATTLHGQLSGVSPLETLDAMLATTRLTYTIGEDRAIELSRRPD